MLRSVAAVAIVLVTNPVFVSAQSVLFTVSASSAGIHQAPASDSPVIAQSAKGTVLDVRRNLGSWLEVTWPSALNRVAYISASMGSIFQPVAAPSHPLTIEEFVALPASAVAPTLAPPASASMGTPGSSNNAAQTMQPGTSHSSSITHMVGLGARIGSTTRSIGPTGRIWTRKRIGVQMAMARDIRTNAQAERITSMQFAPTVLYMLPSSVGDYLWLRPYVGGGMTFYRSNLKSATPGAAVIGSDTDRRAHVLGGGELTFASLPRLAVSADIGYYKAPAPFAGVEPKKVRLEVSGHWFVK